MIEIRIRGSKKVVRGMAASDVARAKDITPQAADKKVGRPGFPKPLATITTLSDDGVVQKVTKVWDPADLVAAGVLDQ